VDIFDKRRSPARKTLQLAVSELVSEGRLLSNVVAARGGDVTGLSPRSELRSFPRGQHF
jgi:hypothetical protein